MRLFNLVTTRLFLLIALPIVMAASLLVVIHFSLFKLAATAQDITDSRLTPQSQLAMLANTYASGVIDVAHKSRAQMLLWSEAQAQLDQARETIAELWQGYQRLPLSEEERVITREAKADYQASLQVIEKLAEFIQQQSAYSMGSFVDFELYPGIEPMLQQLNRLSKLQIQLAERAGQQALTSADALSNKMLLFVLLECAIALGVGYWVYRGISSPMKTLLHTITEIERTKDLSLQADIAVDNEFGDMARRFNRMVATIGKTLNSLKSVSNHLHSASGELLNISDNTRSQAAQQRDEISAVSSAMASVNEAAEHVLKSVKSTEIATGQAESIALEGVNYAHTTGERIAELSAQLQTAVQGVHRLRDDSNAIDSVLEVIGSIAEQTNLLALNAAIEAARAGEQGRGFAVVADEVRQLASRTATSIEEIREIIVQLQQGTQRTVADIERGANAAKSSVESAEVTAQHFQRVCKNIESILDENYQIASAAEEQLAVTETIQGRARAVDSLSHATLNASEQTKTSSESVASRSLQLNSALAEFVLEP